MFDMGREGDWKHELKCHAILCGGIIAAFVVEDIAMDHKLKRDQSNLVTTPYHACEPSTPAMKALKCSCSKPELK